MKNIFIAHDHVIRAISKAEHVDLSVALSMFAANASNIPDEGRVYGGAEIVPMADWAACKTAIDQAGPEQLAEWTAEYHAHCAGK